MITRGQETLPKSFHVTLDSDSTLPEVVHPEEYNTNKAIVWLFTKIIWYSVTVKTYVMGILQISICKNVRMWSLSHLHFTRAISSQLKLLKGTCKNVFLSRNKQGNVFRRIQQLALNCTYTVLIHLYCMSLVLSSQCPSLPKPVTVIFMPAAAASTWSCISYQAAEVEESVLTVDTTQLDGTATTVKRATTETWPRPSHTDEHAKVSNHLNLHKFPHILSQLA